MYPSAYQFEHELNLLTSQDTLKEEFEILK